MKLLLLLPLLMTGHLFASDWQGRFGVGFGLGSTIPLKTEYVTDNSKDALNGAAWLKYHFSESWVLDFAYDRIMYRGLIDRIDTFDLMIGYRFTTSSFVPYIAIGAGYGYINELDTATITEYKEDLDLKARIGFDWLLTDSVAFNLNVDYHYLNVDDSTPEKQFDTLTPMLGLTFYLNDGRPDREEVEEPVVEEEVVKEVQDTDADGVSDENDKCANTKEGTQVDENGCEVVGDSDGDGVNDDLDKCPGTEAGTKVSEFGCAEKQTYSITLDIKFASGSVKLDSIYEDQLQKVADFMNKYKSTNAVIEGHTDNIGKHKSNVWFSKKRAEAVKDYLVNKLGIDAGRLSAEGYGPDQPVADNSTAEGRAQNRRVVAVIKTVE